MATKKKQSLPGNQESASRRAVTAFTDSDERLHHLEIEAIRSDLQGSIFDLNEQLKKNFENIADDILHLILPFALELKALKESDR